MGMYLIIWLMTKRIKFHARSNYWFVENYLTNEERLFCKGHFYRGQVSIFPKSTF